MDLDFNHTTSFQKWENVPQQQAWGNLHEFLTDSPRLGVRWIRCKLKHAETSLEFSGHASQKGGLFVAATWGTMNNRTGKPCVCTRVLGAWKQRLTPIPVEIKLRSSSAKFSHKALQRYEGLAPTPKLAFPNHCLGAVDLDLLCEAASGNSVGLFFILLAAQGPRAVMGMVDSGPCLVLKLQVRSTKGQVFKSSTPWVRWLPTFRVWCTSGLNIRRVLKDYEEKDHQGEELD